MQGKDEDRNKIKDLSNKPLIPGRLSDEVERMNGGCLAEKERVSCERHDVIGTPAYRSSIGLDPH
jgi:hypothetical protein